MKKNITFVEKNKKIAFEEANKIHYRLNKNLVVGIELENQNDQKHHIELQQEFKPTNSYYGVTNERVVEIKGDGSLYSEGAIEVVVIGDNGSFEDQRDALWKIEKSMLKKGYYTDNQTGQHTSLLLQKNFQIPELIMRNLYQITKDFLPEITYLVSTGVNPDINDGVVRKGAIEFANWGVKGLTAKGLNFKQLRQKMIDGHSAGGKYGFFNFYKSKLMPDSSDCGEFFVEYRIPDRCMSASISTAWGFMFKALMLKACSLSRYGLLTISQKEWDKKKQQYDDLFNKDRREILKDKELKEQVKTFLDFLTPEFKRMRENKPLKILYEIAKKPLFSNKYYVNINRAREKKKPLWWSIEEDMVKLTTKQVKKLTSKDFLIRQVLDEGLIGRKNQVFEQLKNKTSLTKPTLTNKLKMLNLKYDNKFKTFV